MQLAKPQKERKRTATHPVRFIVGAVDKSAELPSRPLHAVDLERCQAAIVSQLHAD